MSLLETVNQLSYKKELLNELSLSAEKQNKKYIETLKQLIVC